MTTRKMPKAYSYIRFSTALQAQGDSLRRQTELSSQYATKHGLYLDTSLTLFDRGLSGFTGANRTKGALAVFLHAVETGIVEPGSYLLVESLDRLSRDTISEQMTLFMRMINANIVVVTLTDEQVYSKETINNDISRLMLSLVIMMRAHEESMMKSRRLKAVWDAKRRTVREEKLTGQCPAWLSLNSDKKSFTIVQERAAIVRRIYELSNAGTGHQTIAKILNSEGIPAWGDRGKKFVAGDICDLPLFVEQLRQRENPVSDYLRDLFAESTRQSLGAYTSDQDPRPITEALINELGIVVAGCTIYDPKRFDGVSLSAQTQYLLRANGPNQDSVRLNRLLLEEAYPMCIRRRFNGWQFSYVRFLLRTRSVLGDYQPHRRERGLKRKSIPVGDPVKDYYPPVIDLAMWQRAQMRRKTSTPGRVGAHVSNIFAGIAFDGLNNVPMRFVSKRPRPDQNGVRQGRWRYLVSDYGRMNKGAKAASWRYEWFETWFLDYVLRLDWSTIAKEQAPAEELAAQRKLAAQRAKCEEIQNSIAHLVDLAKKAARPPASLLDELSKLDDQKLEAENTLRQLDREVEGIADRRNALTESADKMRELIKDGDEGSRLRLREDIRRKVRRIDLFPDGVPQTLIGDAPVAAPDMACFRIVFVNSAARFVFCPDKNPAGHAANAAPLLDTNIPDEMLPAWVKKARNQAAASASPETEKEHAKTTEPEEDELRITVINRDGRELSPEEAEEICRRQNLNGPAKPAPMVSKAPAPALASSLQLDMALHEQPPHR